MVAPKHLTPERITRIAMTSVQQTPKLLDCTPESLLGSVLTCTQLGLEPDGVSGRAHLIPYKDKCTLVVGYRGLMDLARRSGEIQSLEARVVYKNDTFEYEYGAHPKLRHVPHMGTDHGDCIAAYAVATMRNGSVSFEVMSREEVDAIKKRSAAGKSGPWVTDYPEMARKTVMRRLCKYLPSSAELQRAVTLDEAADQGLPQHLEPIDIEVCNSRDAVVGASKAKSLDDVLPDDPQPASDAVKQVAADAAMEPPGMNAEAMKALDTKRRKVLGMWGGLKPDQYAVVIKNVEGLNKLTAKETLSKTLDETLLDAVEETIRGL
jgi:recombination protein RecT